MRPFEPLIRNPDLLTILAHFWPRSPSERRYPVEQRLYRTNPETQILVEEQRPARPEYGHLILVHGLESSSRAVYMRSLAAAALDAGYRCHRLNLRSCGGTERLCRTAYHSGLTCDLLAVVRALAAGGLPVFIAGFSLGGNVVLKLAGELGEGGPELLAGVCAVSTPIDLAASVRCIEQPRNRFYETRFLKGLTNRIRVRNRIDPEAFPLDGLDQVRSIREFDDRFTAPSFGFRDAAEYYDTQSAIRFLSAVRVRTLLLQAQDDPVIPFEIYERPEVRANPLVELVATRHGGHVGFLARSRPRFWSDELIVRWMEGIRETERRSRTTIEGYGEG
ncbi:MAG TPA: alpha/beta fold hydrolase [Bryobacteraceae bacterium]|nr:alpha/beta fold hydrolase [Bryobacteraceae bacterium]